MTIPKLPTDRDAGRASKPIPALRPVRRLRTAVFVLSALGVASLAMLSCTGGDRVGPDVGGLVSGPAGAVAATLGPVTITGTLAGGLYPGGSRSVTFTAANPGASSVVIGTVRLVDARSSSAECVAADFTMPDVVQDVAVAGGATATALPGAGTLSMANTTTNQDSCKGADLTLTLFSTSPSDADQSLVRVPLDPADGPGRVKRP